MKKIGVIANHTKPGFDWILRQIAAWGARSTMQIFFSELLTSFIERPVTFLPPDRIYRETEGVLVLGGDGTILSAFREMGENMTPMLGINLGRLGFLTETNVGDVLYALECLQQNDFTLENRLVLQGEVLRNGKFLKRVWALNEMIVSKGEFGRIIQLDLYVGPEFVSNYTADGLILATPTGSTGYSLSAGGPVVAPHVSALVATPICAHTLATRPLIISDQETFRIQVKSEAPNIILTVDGRCDCDLAVDDEIIVSRAPFDALLIKLKNATYYSLLRQKFKWGARATNDERMF